MMYQSDHILYIVQLCAKNGLKVVRVNSLFDLGLKIRFRGNSNDFIHTIFKQPIYNPKLGTGGMHLY